MFTRSPRTFVLLWLGLLGVAGYTVLLTWAMDTQSYNTWGAMIIVPALVALNAVVLSKVLLHEPDRWIRGVVVVAYVVKLVATAARYLVAYVVYGGASDAERYNLYAAEHYFIWRQGIFLWEEGGKSGTQNLELITTAFYTVIGPSTISAFMIFGSLAFWGCFLLLKAFQEALPGGDSRRYAFLVLLLPSMLYWPASIGKEAWLLLFIGVTALGAARFFSGRVTVGLSLLLAGVIGTSLIRPHVTVLMVAALFVAQLTRPATHASTGLLSKFAGILVMGIAAAILVTQSAEFLGIEDISVQSVTDEVDWAAGQTAQGGSSFTPVPLASLFGVPAAIVTVLYRPFPWEADNVQMLAQSMEGLLLIVLTILAWPRIRRLWSHLRSSPYVTFAVVYTLSFIIAFAGFSNFGILARQRSLMLPFFLVLLALPIPFRRSRYRPPIPSRGEKVRV